MKLYLLRGCPFAHRATIVLREKKLDFEPIFFEHGKRPPELEAISPFAKSPTLVDGDTRVWDSQIVIEYLEDRYPSPSLMPKTAEARAEVRMLEARVGSEIGSKQGTLVVETLFKHPRDEAKIAATKKELLDALAPWDALLANKSFLVGDALSLADVTLYTLLPAYERLTREKIPSERVHLRAWLDRMSARPTTSLVG